MATVPALQSSSTPATVESAPGDTSSSSAIDAIQHMSNPFYLHPNENPSLVLVSPVLTGPNYHSWSRAMRMALMSKNKMRFLDRSVPVPTPTDPLFPAWERYNMMVLSWITCSLSPTNSNSGSVKQCTFCGKMKHTEATCYRKHGFPPSFKFRNSSSINTVSGSEVIPSKNSIEQTKVANPSYSFTPEQYQKLLALVQTDTSVQPPSVSVNNVTTSGMCINPVSSLFTTSWIIDSGATDHVCSSLTLFSHYTSISPIIVNLPNGSRVTATYGGSIQFSESFSIHNVLYVPAFRFNLISVSKLTASLPCSVSFQTTKCLIKLLPSWKMIGSADLIEGLYIMTPHADLRVPTINNVTTTPCTTPFDLWHFRLGHLSHSAMSAIHQQFPLFLVILVSSVVMFVILRNNASYLFL